MDWDGSCLKCWATKLEGEAVNLLFVEGYC